MGSRYHSCLDISAFRISDIIVRLFIFKHFNVHVRWAIDMYNGWLSLAKWCEHNGHFSYTRAARAYRSNFLFLFFCAPYIGCLFGILHTMTHLLMIWNVCNKNVFAVFVSMCRFRVEIRLRRVLNLCVRNGLHNSNVKQCDPFFNRKCAARYALSRTPFYNISTTTKKTQQHHTQ